MKLAPLLAQFLYSHKRLDLSGIGSFILDPSLPIDAEPGKYQKSNLSEGIRFQNNPSAMESPELVGFISSQTGKMKALAAADLNSHLELVRQFLNIGKPFLLEGIGSLVKIKSGQYEFTAGDILPEKLKETGRENNPASSPADNFTTYEPFLQKEKTRVGWGKPVLALLAIVGIGLAVLGGYLINQRNTRVKSNNQSTGSETRLISAPAPETASNSNTDNSLVAATIPAKQDKYKFVLETAGRKRAFDRYAKLKNYQWNVELETSDSVQYKIYMLLPTLALDTSRVLDSLTALNGRKVYIEN